MRVIKLKSGWEYRNSNLVSNSRITTAGYTAYWKAIDLSVKFNIMKREEFVVKENFKNLQSNRHQNIKCNITKPWCRKVLFKDKDEDMLTFFAKRRRHDNEASSRETRQEDRSSHEDPQEDQRTTNKFILPKPRFYKYQNLLIYAWGNYPMVHRVLSGSWLRINWCNVSYSI